MLHGTINGTRIPHRKLLDGGTRVPSMISLRSWLNSAAACLLLQLAVATIRLMQWLYGHRLISRPAVEHFFRAAKWLERQADWLTGSS
jgi:hypothetical protein